MIDFYCPVCKTPQHAPEREGGSKRPCTKCGQRLQVPQAVSLQPVAIDQTVAGVPGGPVGAKLQPIDSLPGGATTVKWFYVQKGKKMGPVLWADMVRLVAAKEVGATDLVWCKGMKQWEPAKAVPGLLGGTAHRERPVGRPLARTTQWKWIIIGVGAVAAAVVGLAFFLLGTGTAIEGGKKEQAAQGLAPSSLPSLPARFIQGVQGEKNQQDLSNAVAMVVVGFRLNAPTGQTFTETGTSNIFAMLGHGSGFTISAEGHVVTNEHVVRDYVKYQQGKLDHEGIKSLVAKGITVKPEVWVFFEGKKYEGRILYVSPRFDMSVVKVERSHTPFFKIAERDTHEKAAKVFACGFPGIALGGVAGRKQKTVQNPEALFEKSDFEFVLTTGSINRVLTQEVKGTEQNWVQHDAKIHGGNSGGPLVAENGLVVGINTLHITSLKQTKGGEMQETADRVFYALGVAQLRAEIQKNVPDALGGQ